MIVTSIDRLISFGRDHPDARRALNVWLTLARNARWKSLADIRRTCSAGTDGVALSSGRVITVFNIRGNAYRLLTAVNCEIQSVTVLEVLTHADYDKEKWKSRHA
jgi:mRNA interferase HigB